MCGDIDYAYRLRIGRCDLILRLHDILDLLDRRLNRISRFHAQCEEMQDVALVQGLLHGIERNEDGFFSPAAQIQARCPLVDHSYYLVVKPVHPDIFAARVLVVE